MTPVLPGLELVAPMLAAAGSVPTGPGWAFEFKYDGVRAITYVSGGQTRALSRNGNDVSASYPELGELAELLAGHHAVLDGEVVALEHGRPSFARLQQRIHLTNPTPSLVAQIPVLYYVFDLLHLDGTDLTSMPYAARREALTGLLTGGSTVQVPANYPDADGQAVLKAAELAGLEGIVAKRLTAPYRPGKRSADWTKVPSVGEPRRPAGDNRRSEMAGTRQAVRYRCGGP